MRIFIPIIIAALLGVSGSAHADSEPPPGPADKVVPPAGEPAVPAAGKRGPLPANAAPVPPAAVTLAICEEELRKDNHWQAAMANELLTLCGLRPDAKGTSEYRTTKRGACEAAMRSNRSWRSHIREKLLIPIVAANGKDQLRASVHTADAKLRTRNYRHVIMAYAAMWCTVVVFVIVMWTRQRKLTVEISRLERELAEAIAAERAE